MSEQLCYLFRYQMIFISISKDGIEDNKKHILLAPLDQIPPELQAPELKMLG